MSDEEYRINMNQLNVRYVSKFRELLVETMLMENT